MGRLRKAVRWWVKGWHDFVAVAGRNGADDLVGPRPWLNR
jgi:hypothetical protein